MKILTGRFKGRALPFKPEHGLRPTPDKVRKAIVDAFAGWLEDKRILDLFSGTGALGLELLSAGAAGADFVEKDAGRARRIEQWLKEADFGIECRVWPGEAAEALKRLKAEEEKFDLVVMDPPYEDASAPGLVSRLGGVLNDEAFVVFECRASNDPPEAPGLKKLRDKIYGDTRLAIYKKTAGN